MTPALVVGFSMPASASAAAASRRTFGPSWPGPAGFAPIRRWHSSREIDSINMRRRVRMVDLAREFFGGSIVGRRIAVLGLAFKPNSDDIRDSPALNVAVQMRLQGASVIVTDPQACLLYTSPSPRDGLLSRMPSS